MMKINQCPKHPSYKGLSETKRDCEHCRLIYKQSLDLTKNRYGKFPSLTTPDQFYGINHIMAEISCLMLYGKQPPYFWRKDSQSLSAVKSHYSKIFMGCKQWNKKTYDKPLYGNHPLDTFKKTLYYLVSRYEREANIRKNHERIIVIKEEVTKEKPIEKSYFDTGVKKKNKFQSLKELGDTEDGG